MKSRPFADPAGKPTDERLKAVLGATFLLYYKLNEYTSHFNKSWSFSRSSGWMQKTDDGKKALYYLIPLNHTFKISLTLREKEREAFLKDRDLAGLKHLLEAARKYSEGYALQFDISDTASFSACKALIEKLVKERR